MTCTECPNTIHPERLLALPTAVTCSAGCSRKRQLRHMAAGSKKAHARKRAELRQAPAETKVHHFR